MNHFLPMRLLTREQIERIHGKSLKILGEIGIQVDAPQAVEIFGAHGCRIKGRRVYIPEGLVETVRKKKQKRQVLYSRTGQMVQSEKGKTYVHNAGAVATITDLRTGKQRPATLQDGADLIKLMDALEHIHAVTPIIYPQDVEQGAALLYAVREIIKNTSKPVCGPGVSSLAEAKYIHEMFVLLAGDEKRLREKPMYDLGFSPLSPLTFPQGDTEAIIWAAQKGIAIGALPCPIPGMTAPLSMLGALTQQNAEILAVLTLIRLIDPELPVSYSARLAPADLRYGNTVGGSPEAGIAGACAVQLADYYGMDSNVYGAGTNAILGDAQLGLEKVMNIFLPALVGSNWLSGAGSVADAASVSYEQLVMDDEIFDFVFHFFGSLQDDEEDLGFSTIKDVMEGAGDFIAHENTLRYLHSKECWNRLEYSGNGRAYAGWWENGAKSYLDVIREKVDRILQEHRVTAMDAAVEKELSCLVRSGEKELKK
ncbi:hypothetical protein DCMF_11255 [Candidatus Formimonas warabiya]|uniref:Trimethylamine methyltransferase n=2 Tax=Formimonas warabiya TaxID=1761012 RepID=A0A3G1KS39_FORW1|nr:hypothetical protein DCMF_11255 [Candidatus Formimonas warabiya]